ncbi:SA1362 family protein [Litchfieldia salsa]|uniref:YqhP n=1 Tax=Litchfieldia salsa TaxID=930152 RepID=A0A1H0WJ14_9BACI|nr:SA1362 family protein [Litchfieldia salsa]SDP90627.1 hypothetical protein SAMN05216565_111174 [Litchfieldia salsa]
MNRRRSNLFVYAIVFLGIIGILYTLFTQPSRLLTQLGSIVFFGGIIYLVYKFYMKRRHGSNEHSAYLRAAKQSKRRFNEPGQQKQPSKIIDGKRLTSTAKKNANHTSTTKRKKSTTHLTVIEGKKGKKKNRAFF